MALVTTFVRAQFTNCKNKGQRFFGGRDVFFLTRETPPALPRAEMFALRAARQTRADRAIFGDSAPRDEVRKGDGERREPRRKS